MQNKITVLFFGLVLTLTAQASFNRADLKFDSNVEAPLKQQMLDDLNFISNLQSTTTTPLHEKIFGKVEGAAYAKWFSERIFSIGKSSCGSPNAVACVMPFQDPNKMWVTKNYTQFDHPQVARISVTFHEARHSESQNGNWSHGKCPTPFLNAQGENMTSIWTGALLQGQAACDVTPFGSYGSQTILLKNIAMNCTNCNSKVKSDADLFATDQLGRIVNAAAKAQMLKDFGIARR